MGLRRESKKERERRKGGQEGEKRKEEGRQKGKRKEERKGGRKGGSLKNIRVMVLEVCSKASGKEYTSYNFLKKKKKTKRNKVNHRYEC